MKATDRRTTEIPDRIYFRIGEVSSLVGVDTHVLRYWESEFKLIKPRRAKSGQRLYRRNDVKNLLWIRTLLHDDGYTIAGARRLLKNPIAGAGKNESENSSAIKEEQLQVIKQELLEILQTVT